MSVISEKTALFGGRFCFDEREIVADYFEKMLVNERYFGENRAFRRAILL